MRKPSTQDVLRIALAFAIPELVALQPYLDSGKAKDLPSLWYAVLAAAIGTLIGQLNSVKESLEANKLTPPK